LKHLLELILKQPLVGTTVKTDGRESDPYAILTVLNMHVHASNPSIKAIIDYCFEKSGGSKELQSFLRALFKAENPTSHAALLISERLVNMPVQIVPPMYSMLQNEITWAIDDAEPYKFSHFILFTRTYRLSPEEEAEVNGRLTGDQNMGSKRRKPAMPRLLNGTASDDSGGIYSFHPEDEIIQKYATFKNDFTFTHSQPHEQDSMGVDVAARMFVIPADQLPNMITELQTAFPAPSGS